MTPERRLLVCGATALFGTTPKKSDKSASKILYSSLLTCVGLVLVRQGAGVLPVRQLHGEFRHVEGEVTRLVPARRSHQRLLAVNTLLQETGTEEEASVCYRFPRCSRSGVFQMWRNI